MGHTTTMQYDGMGDAKAVTLPSTGAIGYSYDVRNRLIQRTDALGSPSPGRTGQWATPRLSPTAKARPRLIGRNLLGESRCTAWIAIVP